MATVTLLGSVWNSTAGTKTVTAIPAAGSLILIVTAHSGYVGTTTPTDNNASGTYVAIDNANKATNVDRLSMYIRSATVASAVSTIFTHAPGTTTGGGIAVYQITGLVGTGLSAVVKSAKQENQASGTPAPVMASAVSTNNPVIGAVFTASNTTTNVVQRTGFTEDIDLGYNTPASGIEAIHRDSGETGTTITWGGAAASAFCSMAVELLANTAPTVALNSPANTGSVASTTPQLTFTGTDTNSDDITYEVQIDPANTFNSSGTAATTVDSYSEANRNVSKSVGNGTINAAAQSFTGNGSTLGSVKFFISNSGATSGNVTCFIYAHSGTYGTSSVPTGAALATSSSMAISAISGSNTLVEFTFSGANQITLTNGTRYTVSIEYTGGDALNNLQVGDNNNGSGHGGNASTRTGSTWTAQQFEDLCFYILTPDTRVPVIDALSNTNAGFTNITNGADSDPFTSGNQIGYTVQSALTDGNTYYWRVRAKDPTGSNSYGGWASTQSFTVSTGGGGANTTNFFFAS